MRVLVTGASGFVGRGLVPRLCGQKDFRVRALVRRPLHDLGAGVEEVIAPELSGAGSALHSVDAVVHLAARAHVMRDTAADPLREFRRVNVDVTLQLARDAARSGVKRFVFVSSVKVNGERGLFTESDLPAPQDAYGMSKHEAEEGLRAIARDLCMAVVIVRPPLVYGPGVRANFASLIQAVARGWPLPLASIDNRRSLVGRDNLCDFLVTCLTHPAAANESFLVSDGDDLSTGDLVRRLARAMGRPERIYPFPTGLIRFGATLLGRRAVAERLLDSLQVDISKARRLLGWQPAVSVDEGLRRTVAAGKIGPNATHEP